VHTLVYHIFAIHKSSFIPHYAAYQFTVVQEKCFPE